MVRRIILVTIRRMEERLFRVWLSANSSCSQVEISFEEYNSWCGTESAVISNSVSRNENRSRRYVRLSIRISLTVVSSFNNKKGRHAAKIGRQVLESMQKRSISLSHATNKDSCRKSIRGSIPRYSNFLSIVTN